MAKRFTASAVNWSIILENLPKHESSRVVPLKMASEKYLREIARLPAELPKLDWSSYRKKISVPGMVDSFQKSYESLKVPYPPDQGLLAESEKFNSNLIKLANKNSEELKKGIAELTEELKKLEKIMKVSEMTLEEYCLCYPEACKPRIKDYEKLILQREGKEN